MKYYTGAGDKGKSTLFGCNIRITKNDKTFFALGALDELNSYIGVCKAHTKDKALKKILKKVQENIFIIQADVASPKRKIATPLKIEKVRELEKDIAIYAKKIGVITKFILPGGTPLSAHLDYARALARSAERKIVGLKHMNEATLTYLNRLSSLLFVLARYANKKAGISEDNPSYK